MKKVYLDNAASTPIDENVVAEIVKVTKLYGNPSSYNDRGREAREYTERARLKVARFLGAHSDEIIFTASGTEANNLAIFGLAHACSKRSRREIISTPIEHPSILRPLKFLKQKGWEIKFVRVDQNGLVDLNDLKNKLNSRTVLVSVMYANNEIGTIEPITKISKIIRDFREEYADISKFRNIRHEKFPIFHVDACQATEYLDMNVNHLGVDLLTFNGSKIYGPKGVGVLYARRGVKLSPIMLGGEQEAGLRAGTENLMAIGGLAVALDNIDTHSTHSTKPQGGEPVESTSSGQEQEGERLAGLRDDLIEKVGALLPDVKINGPVDNRLAKSIINRLPNNVNISVPDLTSEVLLLELDKYGICAGSGSACTSHAVEPSHVLKAIGLDKKYINGALRFSMGRQTTKKDIDYVLKVLPKIIQDLKKRYKK
ncbi:MAG: hypothetical protein A2655_02960 [Candidatus Yanofskybacteria bacterium RIFCSPHIGHO2_01_FULL_43_42]|uniref:Aminotransferase class V domain-containing protein n=1 Tax=Candidatus Yanofskybacteria bacterium RIFCSPLOWO2_01_FULL_43_22 TaxID=1802695 RepID=A0A1F8GEZ5_9BACT|nr:MAG: hypothetical protein A2655_02960 [Candidatus Yanofskybacteria bacterium RIFCSPHIGHO2_01_FULL_43_42]OGN12962.1 MAG: hypothetical protein A3D48_03620 [Candidatus Yanofskybacteria bacterium RIFCSPHIGHO2_02_FULL_43_17]OGN23957.1 MAG: hypothetical protein A3A13_02635 [Candidatus Yanofskybacteria bacterium RIFCSPLOWO2_01_FULL_43_22]